MNSILSKMIDGCVPLKNMKLVSDLIANEKYHYVELHHKSMIQDKLWGIGEDIKEHNMIEIKYSRVNDTKEIVKRIVEPVSILFSEYYFYLTAFIDDEDTKKDFDVINDSFPTIYRIDRIKKIEVSDECFHIPYSSRFEEGEFRKRIQFMFGGKLERITFTYSGVDVDSVLDRLPTAQLVSEENGVYTITAEVFGKGIDMWLMSQGEMINVIERR